MSRMSFDQLPTNRNFLNPTNFMLAINRLPSTVLNCQKVIMPTLTLGDIRISNPFNKLNVASAANDFGNLTIVFKVDEDFANYRELFDWMIGLGFPEDFQQYADLKHGTETNKGLRSDASLVVETSSKNANVEWVFRDIFPVFLGEFVMESDNRGANFVTASCVFSIRDFVPRLVNEPVSP